VLVAGDAKGHILTADRNTAEYDLLVMAYHLRSVCAERHGDIAKWAGQGAVDASELEKELDSAAAVLDAMQRTLRELGSRGQAARLEALVRAAANKKLGQEAMDTLNDFIADLLQDIYIAGGLISAEAGHTIGLKQGVNTVMTGEGGDTGVGQDALGKEVLKVATSHRSFVVLAFEVHNFVADALLVVPHGELHGILVSTHLRNESGYLQTTYPPPQPANTSSSCASTSSS
jgi:hypothetical protein